MKLNFKDVALLKRFIEMNESICLEDAEGDMYYVDEYRGKLVSNIDGHLPSPSHALNMMIEVGDFKFKLYFLANGEVFKKHSISFWYDLDDELLENLIKWNPKKSFELEPHGDGYHIKKIKRKGKK
jgi:hypothetical protein